MLASAPVSIVVGTVLGFLAGLGVGGGSLLILWLTMVLQMEPLRARGINLLFFLPAAVISSFFHGRQGTLRLRLVIPGMVSGCLAAAVFSRVGLALNSVRLQKLFGILLLFTGLRELLYKPRKKL